jgi:16S rRNA processing protein RimM
MANAGNHIGTLIKAHGYKGEMLLKGNPEVVRKLEIGIALFIEISGQRIPFFIEDFSTDTTGEKVFLKLEFIDSDFDARRYLSCEVYADFSIDVEKKSVFSLKDHIGFKVIDLNSKLEYLVTDFYDSPENPILVLERGKDQFLLPQKADYILRVDYEKNVMEVDFPDGFFE